MEIFYKYLAAIVYCYVIPAVFLPLVSLQYHIYIYQADHDQIRHFLDSLRWSKLFDYRQPTLLKVLTVDEPPLDYLANPRLYKILIIFGFSLLFIVTNTMVLLSGIVISKSLELKLVYVTIFVFMMYISVRLLTFGRRLKS